MNQRLLHNRLYNSPGFKEKWWFDSGVYSEQTPLLMENMQNVLAKYTNYSEVFNNLDDYYTLSKFKSIAPQIVGLEDLDHWITVEKNGSQFKFIDSSGCPEEAYEENGVKDLPGNYIAQEKGSIRQSPFANSCGFYALFYCLGKAIYDSPYYFWDGVANRVVNYHPFTVKEWRKAYAKPDTDLWLHLNDVALFELYKNFMK